MINWSINYGVLSAKNQLLINSCEKMARLSLITVYLASIFAIHFVIVSSETWGDISEKLETINISINVNASSPKNMTKTVAENKNLTKLVEEGQIFTKLVESKPQHLLQPRAVTTGSVAATTTITYRLGNRVSGDRVIASTSAGQQWAVAQNITQNLVYPRAGVGAIITYVEIIVDQVKS